MKKTVLVIICALAFWAPLTLARDQGLANEGKRGLYVRSIDQVLRLREDEVDLATAALIISEQWSDMVQGRRYLTMLDEMALEIQEKLSEQWLRPTYKAIPVINRYLFRELGFRPVSEAENPNDLFLHSVLDRKRGYCLSLSILYLSLAERLGMPMYGVVVPGHFFVRYDDGRTRWNIETTNEGANALDKHYVEKFKVPEGDGHSLYMKNLDKIQTLGCLFNNLGNMYCDTGQLEAALTTLQTAVEINPMLAESRANLANVYLKMGRIEQAVLEYQQALEINPSDPKTHSNIGNAYVEQGRFREAVFEYMEALALDPNFVDAHKNLAIAYSKQEMFGLAAGQLKQALSLEPEDAGLHTQLGEVYRQMGDYEQAIARYQKALTIKQMAETHYGLAMCYHKLDLVDDEIEAYKKALALKPAMLAARVNLGNAYFGKKDYDAAIEQYRSAIRIAPGDARIHCNLAAAYTNKADYEQSMAAYLKAVEIAPGMGDAHYGLAFSYYKLNKYDLAWKHMETAKKLGVNVTEDELDTIKQNLK